MFSIRNIPPVTKNLLIITLLVWFATLWFDDKLHIMRLFALHYPLAPDFKPHQFVTYIFLHATHNPFTGEIEIGHIFFNMLSLVIFGPMIENAWGSKRFLIFYVVTGLGAALCQLVVIYFRLLPDMEYLNALMRHTSIYQLQEQIIEVKRTIWNGQVVIGASGSLVGMLLAAGMLYPDAQFLLPIKLKYFVALYGGTELIAGLEDNLMDNVAHFAHLGGMLFGFLLIMFWRRKSRY